LPSAGVRLPSEVQTGRGQVYHTLRGHEDVAEGVVHARGQQVSDEMSCKSARLLE